MATADKLQNVIDVKNGLADLIEDNNVTPPTLFSNYPVTIEDIIDNIKNAMIIMDTIKLNANTTLAQVNYLFNNLPEANSYTATTTCTNVSIGVNVRSSGSSSGTAKGKLGTGDVVPILGTASSGWYRINRYRYGTSYSNALKTYNDDSAYVSNSESYVTTTNVSYKLKQIDISALSSSIQNSCNYKIAESKGWVIMFGQSQASDTVMTTQTTEFKFNNCYTDNYSTSSFSTKVGTNTSTIRQGHWTGYYYYKGNLRFTSARLNEIKAILSNSDVSKMEIYLQRANTENGNASASYISLYACDSSGSYSDLLVNNTSTLSRGGSIWITLSSTVINGFTSGKYDHFKVYRAAAEASYYIVYDTNAKIRITYTA